MLRWPQVARVAVGAFGIACAVVVYVSLGERRRADPPPPVERIDPTAVAESLQGVLTGVDERFELRFATMVTYDDGSTRLTGVQITAPNRDGRTFVVTAREAREATGSPVLRTFELEHDVRVRASDGFELSADRGSFVEADASVHAPGPVTFGKDRLSGSGRGMTYNLDTDVLRVAAEADVRIAGEPGGTDTRVTAQTATLDRAQDTLELDRDVRVDGDQAMRADRAAARLSPGGSQIVFIALRGGAAVERAGPVEAMQARDIDLDYTEDGRALERATLMGDATVAVRNGAAAQEFGGQHLDVAFAADGTLGRVSGHSGVEMTLPASEEAPERRVGATTFEGTGRGGALAGLRFDGDVVFREDAGAESARVARSRTLALDLSDDGALGRAVFSGHVTFEDATFTGRAADAQYDPSRAALVLTGSDARGEPSVEDDSVVVEAGTIAIALDAHRVEAERQVKTTVRPGRRTPAATRGDGAAREEAAGGGLLAPGQAARVTADSLIYEGTDGAARYSGRARLWQQETDLSADTISLNLETGDLTAVGQARAVMALDGGRSEGEAHEIVYRDDDRRLSYTGAPAAEGRAATIARLNGPQGDLRAARIAVFLADEDRRVTRLDAEGAVDALVDDRRVTGSHLAYRASDDEYLVAGRGTVPVRLRTGDPCREMVGRTLIYSRSTDRMLVDGSDVSRTQTARGDACQ